MVGETPHTTRDPRAEHPCPACGEPRQVVAERHKVLGAWVPEWVVQPCRNPECELYESEGDAAADGAPRDPAGNGSGHASGHGSGPGEEPGAEATTTHVTGKNGETGRSPAPG
ncbi:hypothetical protein [Streptomyces sp. NPDC051909]|uniref:hypothetical protein n=1 Tax=Streptomyces sp. NPDC051909 TaxID=3154944 RepID=UPI003441DE7C